MQSSDGDALQRAAWYLLQELKSSWLEVCLIDGRRTAIQYNAQWYQDLCSTYVRSRKRHRKQRTIIKRCHTIKLLTALAYGRPTRQSIYLDRLGKYLEAYS